MPNQRTKINSTLYIIMAAFSLLLIGFVYWYIRQEQFIYAWDYANYWMKSRQLDGEISRNPISAAKMVMHSVRNEDYNYLISVFLSPFIRIFGGDRMPYVMSVCVVFLVPVLVTTMLLVRRTYLSSGPPVPISGLIVATSTIWCFPSFLIPILLGIPDIAGVLVINMVLYLYLRKPPSEQSTGGLIMIGSLLALMMLIRRWYAYWAVSFMLAAMMIEVMRIVLSSSSLRQYFIKIIRFGFVISLAVIVVLFAVAAPILKRMILTDYHDLYSAFRSSDFLPQIIISLGQMYQQVGPFSLLFAVFGGAFSLRRTGQMRVFSFFLIVQMTIIFIHFSLTQDFSIHHWYLFCSYIAFFAGIGALTLIRGISNKALRLSFTAIYLLFVIMNFSMVFVPETENQSPVLNSMFPYVRHYPPIRHDLAEIDRMVDKLDSLTIPGRNSIYVLASSLVLSDDVLRNAAHQGHEQQKILLSSHVDKRDGFPSYLLSADYVVTAVPLQRHLRAEDQQVVAIPLMDIEQQRGIGLSFKRTEGPFNLEGGVKAYIYKRIAPMRKADMDSLEKMFVSRYPAHRDRFKINHLCGLIETNGTDLSPATMDCKNNSLSFNLGENKPAMITFRLGRDYRTFSALFKPRNISDTKGGCEERLKIFADGKQIFSDRMIYLNPRNLSFNVANVNVLTISVDKGNNGSVCDWFAVDNPVIE